MTVFVKQKSILATQSDTIQAVRSATSITFTIVNGYISILLTTGVSSWSRDEISLYIVRMIVILSILVEYKTSGAWHKVAGHSTVDTVVIFLTVRRCLQDVSAWCDGS